MTKEQFEQRLKEFPSANDVHVVGNGKFVAEMVVRSFEDVDEADRQERVYAFLRERFSDDEMMAVEYIITNAPGDLAP
jgi:acid stress-induced BolA-like protein IbaG/YrbA